MVLALALHHDTPALEAVVEEALSRTLAVERGRSTPRLAGAFLLDSYAYTIEAGDVGNKVLWCPSEMPDWGDEGPPWERTGEGEGEPAEGEPAEGEVEPPELPDCATLCTKVVMCSPEMPAEDCLRGCATSFALLPPEQAAAIGECILTTPCEAVEGTDLGEYCMGGGGGGKEGEGEGEGEGDKEGGGSMASLACAIGLTNPGLSLGPFTLGMLPILPSRAMYLDFIDTWSDAQAGKVRSLDFRVPELPPHADHVDVPPYGVATFSTTR